AAARRDPASSPGVVQATWLDPDAEALELGLAVVREREAVRAAPDRISLRVATVAGRLDARGSLDDRARFDVVLVGNVLSELDVAVPAEQRVAIHAAWLADLLERRVDAHGSLVVVEPALRDRTRHLHRVRDSLAAVGVTVFAPCLHAAPCPALDRESDWCHEDVPVHLPRWLEPIARKAGLRWQGLTFSYLIVRKDGVRMADALDLPSGAARLRVVSDPIRTKGKSDVFLCGELPAQASPRGVRIRTTRLDRDVSDLNASWGDVHRGDTIVVDPAPNPERPRIGGGARVSRLGDTESR
ncbi:MAG: small ribosomal subunit Rsm22 family protein, partial [Myxococcota bacterium]|nr:small ribosomal subunit Rsm22 family protein [Myxococcota bacterium]